MFCLFNKNSNVDPAPEAKTTIFMRLFLPTLLIFATHNLYAGLSRPASAAHNILKITQTAPSHDDWHEQQVQIELQKNRFFRATPNGPQERCEELRELPAQDLLVFYNELSSSSFDKKISCRTELKLKMDMYLLSKDAALRANGPALSQEHLAPCSDLRAATFGPAEIYPIATQQGGVFWGKNYPRCYLSITFDDGPHATLTPRLLQQLKEENLLVNFFVVGKRVNRNPKILQAAADEGHVIGNHSYSHLDMRKIPFKQGVEEIENTFSEINTAIGQYIPFFRFPYGAHTADLRTYLQQTGRVEFFWNIDSRDWAIRDPEELYVNLLKEINKYQKGVLLLHDVQPQTITVFPHLLLALKTAGYMPYLMVPADNYVP